MIHSRVTRRALLIAIGSVGMCSGAGCLRNESVLNPDPVTKTTILMEAVTDAQIGSKTLITMTRGDAEFMADVLDGGAKVKGERPRFRDGHVNYKDTVYDLYHTSESTSTMTRFEVEIRPVQGDAAADKTVRYGQLPDIDQHKLAGKSWDEPTLGQASHLDYSDQEQQQSALVPQPETTFLSWGGDEVGRWIVKGSSEVQLTARRWTVTEWGPIDKYGTQVRKQQVFELVGLSDAETEIIQQTTDTGAWNISPDETASDAVKSLIERFRDKEPVHPLDRKRPEPFSGPYLMRYDGTVYWTRVQPSVLEQADPATPTPTEAP